MVQIEDRHLNIIKSILQKYNYDFYLFGSRAAGKARKFSDLDLFFTGTIPGAELETIKEDFENSNLPYTVDIVDFNKCSQEFQQIIKQGSTLISAGSCS